MILLGNTVVKKHLKKTGLKMFEIENELTQ